jgi:methionyl aminopeptidase
MPPTLRSNDLCWCGSGRKYKRCHKPSEDPVTPGRVGPRRAVPPDIPRPDYAETGMPGVESADPVATPDVIRRMRVACRLAAEILERSAKLAEPGVTTDEIDAFVHQATIESGAYPSTLNYKGYPKSCCTSVNEVICHGIPDDRALENGDIINIDVTVFLDGVHGDTDATFAVGTVHLDYLELMKVTRECLDLGIEAVVPGRPIYEIGRAISMHAQKHGYGVVRAFTGHGVGELFHNGLTMPHHFDTRYDTLMQPGMIFTIEPMITLGTWQHRSWPDGWTAVTADGRRTAQYEHTVLVTDSGAEVLTLP